MCSSPFHLILLGCQNKLLREPGVTQIAHSARPCASVPLSGCQSVLIPRLWGWAAYKNPPSTLILSANFLLDWPLNHVLVLITSHHEQRVSLVNLDKENFSTTVPFQHPKSVCVLNLFVLTYNSMQKFSM